MPRAVARAVLSLGLLAGSLGCEPSVTVGHPKNDGAGGTGGSTGSAGTAGSTSSAGTAGSTSSVGTTSSSGGCSTMCGSACVDLQNDNDHCGACGTACAHGWYCDIGTCHCMGVSCTMCGCGDTGLVCASDICVCPNFGSMCNGVCKDVQFDDANCGFCGVACGPEQHCYGGGCNCVVGKTCGSACVDDLGNDPENCGACGKVCPAPMICQGGSCL